ncbi:MAG: hypothetical protein MUF28_12715 [Ignavibacterium sp.]|jgi:hypothetical protein|nr:hypothetical protein [Ignavibacterium sp.]
MKNIVLVFFVMSISSNILSQDLSQNQLDSLYNLFTFIKGVNTSEKLQKQLEQNPAIKKCGMEMVYTLSQNLKSYSSEQQQVLSKILQRPTMQTNTLTPSGFFRVHYDLTGPNALGYNLNLLLTALDSAYNFEINYLGYPAPPSDGSEGGDDKYDIYIQNLAGLYGYTQFETKVTDSRWTSFMVIDNDYVGYYSSGIDGAKVTVAHEFHHGIQGGNYAPAEVNAPFRSADIFYYEITSTAMEEFVQDDINDYYAYMNSYFQNPENSMPNNDGYNLAIWNIYLQKNFGFDVLKRQWDLIPGNNALKAIALSLDEAETNFGNELNKFGIWTYFTNSRNIYPDEYFEEAGNYPLINPAAVVSFSPPSDTYNMTIAPVANYFLKINLPSSDGVFYSIITNSDYQRTSNQTLPFSFSIYQDTVNGEKAINDFYSVSFDKDGQTFWNNAGILNNIVVYGDSSYAIPDLEGETYAYPMPVKKSSANKIYIAFQSDDAVGEEVDLNIYSAGVELYYSDKKNIQSAYSKDSNKYCEISLDKSEVDFPSGVYIYVIKSGEDIFKGKLVIFND